MSLRVRRVPSVKYKLLTAMVAAFALVAQPMYGALAGYVASAAAPKVVNTTTSEEFDTIQQAINDNNTLNTHVISVPAGTYTENVTITKSLTLRGAQAGNDARTRTIDAAGESIINGGTGVAVRISAPNVTIDGFQVIQTRSGSNVLGAHAVEMSASYAGITLQNNIVARTGDGSAMHLYGGQNITVQKNYFTDTANNGLVMRNGNGTGATNQKIIDNKFTNIRAMTGGAIVVYGQSGLEIARNNITASFSGISIGATGAAHYIMNGINVHDNNVNIVLDQTQPNTYRHAILVEGSGTGISIKNNNLEQSGEPPVATTRYALVRISYDGTAATDTNIVNLVISENNLKSNVNDRYILVGQNVTNQIDASKNWWGSQANPASKVTSPTAMVVSSPWLCQSFEQALTVSNDGSCVPPNAAPTTTLKVNGQDSPALVGNKFTVSGLAKDDTALNRVYVQLVNRQDNKRYGGTTINLIGKGASAEWTHTYDATALNLPEGKYAAHVSVTDMTGKSGTAGWTSNFVLDKTAPVAPALTVNGSSAATVYTNQYNMTANWTVPGGDAVRYEYVYWNDISTSVYNASNPWVKPTTGTTHGGTFDQGKGNHYIKVRAFDAAGNSSESSTVKVVYETTAPTIEGVTVDKSLTNQAQIKVNGTVKDDNLKNYNIRVYNADKSAQVSPGIFSTGSGSVENSTLATLNISGLADGNYNVRIWADDLAGNRAGITSQIYIPFTVDRTAPSATVNVTTSNNVATATLSGVSESIENVDGWTQVGSVWTREHNVNGSYFVTIEDLAGNTKTINYSVNSIDNVPPAVTVTSATRNSNGTYTLTGTTSDASDDVAVSVNGASALPATVAGTTWQFVTQILADGLYTVAVTSTDEYGNSGSLSPVYSFTAVAPFLGGNGLSEEAELVVTDLSNVPGAAQVGATPQTFAAATGVTGEDTDQNDTAILGAQTSKQPAAAAPAIEATESGWKIFGLAWYWWLAILAAIAAAWWAIAGYRRRQDEA